MRHSDACSDVQTRGGLTADILSSEATAVSRPGPAVDPRSSHITTLTARATELLETQADGLRRDIEQSLYKNILIPDSRGDVLGLIETADDVLTLFQSSLWAFYIEKPVIHEQFTNGYKRLTNMVIKAVDELALSCRAFFRNPHAVPSHNIKITLYEKEADKVSSDLKMQIFESKIKMVEKLHLRDFVNAIDGIADRAEDVADRLSIYAIKRLT